jgi:hypothetical protein
VCGLWGVTADAAMIQCQRRGLLRPALSLALALRKWVKDANESGLPTASNARILEEPDSPAVVPIDALWSSPRATLISSERVPPDRLHSAVPNGVKLSLECGDVDALTAIHWSALRCSD